MENVCCRVLDELFLDECFQNCFKAWFMYLVSRVSDCKVVTCYERRDIFEMATIKVKGRFEQNIFSCVKLSSKIYVKKKMFETRKRRQI